MKYSFRAECISDVCNFLDKHGWCREIFVRGAWIEGIPIPDVDVILHSTLTLEEVRDIMKEVPDGHVMVESLKEIDYSRSWKGDK